MQSFEHVTLTDRNPATANLIAIAKLIFLDQFYDLVVKTFDLLVEGLLLFYLIATHNSCSIQLNIDKVSLKFTFFLKTPETSASRSFDCLLLSLKAIPVA